MKDSIDFGSMDISTLFRKLLVPTVLGMVFSAIFVITDGIFVGKGIGSDALAAVNITAPLFMIATGIGLMFGVGGSVVASIYLSQGKRKAANINITQALVFSTFIVLVMSALCFCFVGRSAKATVWLMLVIFPIKGTASPAASATFTAARSTCGSIRFRSRLPRPLPATGCSAWAT